MKNLKGGEAMERKEMQTTPAGRVSQQNQKGGEAMKERIRRIVRRVCEETYVFNNRGSEAVVREGNWIVWSRRVSDGYPVPFVILQFKDKKDYTDFLSAENKDKFLADRLAGETIYIPDEEEEDGWGEVAIPPYTTEEGYRDTFWWGKENVYETPEEAYQRVYEDQRGYLLEMWLRWPIEKVREEVSIDMIEEEAKERADAFFTDLVVVEL
jgi:hypothetical protein